MEMVSLVAVLLAVAAGLTAGNPSVGAGQAQGLGTVVTIVLVALVVQAEEMGAAGADGGYDEASVVSLVSKDPGFGGRYLPKHQQEHPEQTAATISYTWVWKSTPVFQICTNVLRDTSLLL